MFKPLLPQITNFTYIPDTLIQWFPPCVYFHHHHTHTKARRGISNRRNNLNNINKPSNHQKCGLPPQQLRFYRPPPMYY